ncbi:MAG: hypothetical protein CVT95_13205 [Bacteroidetes bacterium HGW-Bacteroidetes-12]|nr:MAG: hypothetical protein CVT95_13205 [Bacteroidetes bacterium HGW-Bacteroidetes-12]
MDKIEHWKNFSLGTELEISGNFIYNGLKIINTIENFHYPEQVFEFFYNISVGIERLEKIAIILIEHNEIVNLKVFDKSLKNHKHQELLKRITKKHPFNFGKIHSKFIQILSVFYSDYRYDRYMLNDKLSYSKEKTTLIEFIKSGLNIEIKDNFPFEISKNTRQIKFFLSKIIGKITSELYGKITSEARDLNIYTYELRKNSKAYNVFLQQDYVFEYEEILKKEFIIKLINNSNSNFVKFIKKISPLNFDVQDENDIIKCLLNNYKLCEYFDELDELYDNIENKKERFECLEILGMNGI